MALASLYDPHLVAPANALHTAVPMRPLADRVVEMPWGPRFKRKVLKWLRRYRRGMFKWYRTHLRWTTNNKRLVVIAFQVHYGQLHWALEMLNL